MEFQQSSISSYNMLIGALSIPIPFVLCSWNWMGLGTDVAKNPDPILRQELIPLGTNS